MTGGIPFGLFWYLGSCEVGASDHVMTTSLSTHDIFKNVISASEGDLVSLYLTHELGKIEKLL